MTFSKKDLRWTALPGRGPRAPSLDRGRHQLDALAGWPADRPSGWKFPRFSSLGLP